MKLVFVSYHYYPYTNQRSTIVHNFFLDNCSKKPSLNKYSFLYADWDHQIKAKSNILHELEQTDDVHVEGISVPPYYKNLSIKRIWSHLVFSCKVAFHKEFRNADILYVCVPPSFSAFLPALRMIFKSKSWVVDVVDLWPEALPAAPIKKKLLNLSVGWIWKILRNFFYKRATAFVGHCKFFIKEIGIKPRKVHYIPLSLPNHLGVSTEVYNNLKSQRHSVREEIRILVLGSINHVLDIKSLLNITAELHGLMANSRKLVVEIIGGGESKNKLLEGLGAQAAHVELINHGMSFDEHLKRQVLSRCHFGYNGYSSQTAIGVTYKSIDFASYGLVFLNSVSGDLKDLIQQYGAGFNYVSGAEQVLANQILALSEDAYGRASEASRKIYEDLFRPEQFQERMSQLLASLERR